MTSGKSYIRDSLLELSANSYIVSFVSFHSFASQEDHLARSLTVSGAADSLSEHSKGYFVQTLMQKQQALPRYQQHSFLSARLPYLDLSKVQLSAAHLPLSWLCSIVIQKHLRHWKRLASL